MATVTQREQGVAWRGNMTLPAYADPRSMLCPERQHLFPMNQRNSREERASRVARLLSNSMLQS